MTTACARTVSIRRNTNACKEKKDIYLLNNKEIRTNMSNLRLKECPDVVPRPISNLILSKDLYDVDETYQRAPGVWSKEMEQYLIDSIIRGYSIPPIIVHKKGKKRFIVDGQQRWNAIMKFGTNNLELNEKYSKDIISENNGSTEYDDLTEEWRNRFNSYSLTLYHLDDYNDEEIRSTFLRLQVSKPLTPGEKLNAYPGKIVLAMRELGKHIFFNKSISMGVNRYKDYKMAATFLLLEKEGIKSVSPWYLYDFFSKNGDLTKKSYEYNKVKKTLNFLRKSFPSRTPELKNQAWIVSTYLLTSKLIDEYVIEPEHVNDFLKDFYSLIVNAKTGLDKELLDFREAVSKGTNNEETIALRHRILFDRFNKMYNLPSIDENRIFSYEQKLKIFRRDNEQCQECGDIIEFGEKTTHYHHKTMHSQGGPTTVDNGLLVCRKCHYTKIHGKR